VGSVHDAGMLTFVAPSPRHKALQDCAIIQTIMVPHSNYHLVNLRAKLRDNPKMLLPALTASLIAAGTWAKVHNFARQIRKFEVHVLKHHALPDTKSGKGMVLARQWDGPPRGSQVPWLLPGCEVTLGLASTPFDIVIFPSLGMSDTLPSLNRRADGGS